MKTFKFFAISVALVFVTASCVENSKKYKTVIAQRDSVEIEKQVINANYNQTLVLLNDIENGFTEINQNQSQMKMDIKGVEAKTANKKERISAQMTVIKTSMEQNKAKIAELRQLASKNIKTNSKLTETITRLQVQMDEKAVQIQNLQAELEQKNIKINELNTTVNIQNKNLSEQQYVMDQQRSTLKVQDADLNTVWYCISTAKKLKEAKIISIGGLFQNKKLLDNDFDKSSFTQIDLRTVIAIVTESKSVKIISSHPKSSYIFETDIDKKITIKITNPSKFWSVSKYLVVQI